MLIGGMLTNWYTTKTRLQKFKDLRMQQKTRRLNNFFKRDAVVLKRHLAHLKTYLCDIKYMTRLPDIVIIVDQQEEYTALRECITFEIPTIYLIDTIRTSPITGFYKIVSVCFTADVYVSHEIRVTVCFNQGKR